MNTQTHTQTNTHKLTRTKNKHTQTNTHTHKTHSRKHKLHTAPPGVCTHLQRDVGLRPVLEVGQQEVRVPVDEVDADELLAARPPEAGQTLAEGAAGPLHARRLVLAVGQLAQGPRGRGSLAQLTAAGGLRNRQRWVVSDRHWTAGSVANGMIALTKRAHLYRF